MTRKDYIRLAIAMKNCKPEKMAYVDSVHLYTIVYDQWVRSTEALADTLAWDNPAFNRAKFFNACDGIPFDGK